MAHVTRMPSSGTQSHEMHMCSDALELWHNAVGAAEVGVAVGVDVGVELRVTEGVDVGVYVRVAVGVDVSVEVGVGGCVNVGVELGVTLGVD